MRIRGSEAQRNGKDMECFLNPASHKFSCLIGTLLLFGMAVTAHRGIYALLVWLDREGHVLKD